MYGLAVLVEAGAPGIVPQATPIALLVEANNVGDLRSLGLRLLEGPQLTEPTGTRSDNRNTCHDLTPSLVRPLTRKTTSLVFVGSVSIAPQPTLKAATWFAPMNQSATLVGHFRPILNQSVKLKRIGIVLGQQPF